MGEIIHGKLDLIILFEISSYPLEFLSLNDLIIFSTSYVEAYSCYILVKGLLKEFTK
jgi:hypothetical protein